MKLSLAFFAICSAATAFVPPTAHRVVRSSSARFATVGQQRPDVAAAVQSAVEAAKAYGAASPEARVAWDIVEELSASDNSVAYQPTSEQECLVEEEVSQACVEYAAKLGELQASLQSIAPHMREVRRLADDIQAVKLRAQPVKPAPDSPQLRAALKRAQEQSSTFGPESPEARVAWSEVEEIASAGLENSMGVRLDEECLVESAMEACQALEELNRAMSQQRTKESGLNNF